MKNIINATLENMTKDVLDVIIIAGIVLVITIGAAFNYCVDFDENSNVDSYTLIDDHLETLDAMTDDLTMVVNEYNEAYYAYYDNELSALDGNG